MRRQTFIVLFVLLLLVTSVFAATRVFRVQETDFVKVNVNAVDPDQDRVTYAFSSPLDEKGEWQTDFGDAGEYFINITASDGNSTSVEQVKILVAKKNRAPYIKEKKITIKENEVVDLKKVVEDHENDPLRFLFSGPFDKEGIWKPSYSDAGTYVFTFTVDDGEYKVPARVEIIVTQQNQPPEIISVFSDTNIITAKEGENLKFFVTSQDGDGDDIKTIWKFDGRLISQESKDSYALDFDSAGKHELELTLDDGDDSIDRKWELMVDNTNRKPEFGVGEYTVKEGEKVFLKLPSKDQDGDTLSYTFGTPFDENGMWATNYDDAGNLKVTIIAKDQEFTVKKEAIITVLDVDRKPELLLPESLTVREGEQLNWNINTTDLDGDAVTLTIEGAPEGATLYSNNKIFVYEPGFDILVRKGGFFSNILNSLRLEKYFIKNQKHKLTVKACGKDLCSSGTTNLYIKNVNRAPSFDQLPKSVTVTETELLTLLPTAIDPDGDVVHFSFSEPLDLRTGKWIPMYGEHGVYEVYIAAEDGELTTTTPVEIRVLKKNREPSLNVRDEVLVNEGKPFSFLVGGSDEDHDNLTLVLKNLPKGASFNDGRFEWTAPATFVVNKTDSWWNNLVSRGSYSNKKLNSEKNIMWLEFAAYDGIAETIHPVKLTVKNVNQKPTIVDYSPNQTLQVNVGEPVVFTILGEDQDGDELHYSWDFGLRQGQIKGSNAVERTFVASGNKKVSVEVSDGRDSVGFEWSIDVVETSQVVLPSSDPGLFKVYVIEG
ncbi:PKD domain-containing protein [Candidatus Woesearchaeota archaeon]|jgi:hypothetical protein|nr:PKD domain-containing protein [Candidatus Woesearchaeota archaeon]MBT4151034.1 PKD domain-containing protein [Candidatus Woesearchaeota archaeon]MBT4433824.1 PKD domain-containing protein [Candidatus Woesearchaeota archaeon]